MNIFQFVLELSFDLRSGNIDAGIEPKPNEGESHLSDGGSCP
jgi:hypothetical protein